MEGKWGVRVYYADDRDPHPGTATCFADAREAWEHAQWCRAYHVARILVIKPGGEQIRAFWFPVVGWGWPGSAIRWGGSLKPETKRRLRELRDDRYEDDLPSLKLPGPSYGWRRYLQVEKDIKPKPIPDLPPPVLLDYDCAV